MRNLHSEAREIGGLELGCLSDIKRVESAVIRYGFEMKRFRAQID